MAINYTVAIKNARLAVVRDAIDAGSSAGKLRILDFTETTVLVEVPFADPSGVVANGVLTFTIPLIEPVALETGTAARATLVTSANALVADGLTVGTASADVILNSTQINAGQPVTIIDATLVHG
jgi:hypothetical protein